MGKFGLGARVRDNDGDEGVIVGKSKGYRDVKYETGAWAGDTVTHLVKAWLTPIATKPVVAPATPAASPEKGEYAFKVGDRVRVVKHCNYHGDTIPLDAPIGSEHVITEMRSYFDDEGTQTFKLSDGGFNFYIPANIELLPVAEQPAGFRVNGIGAYTTRDGQRALVTGAWDMYGSDYQWSGKISEKDGEFGLLWKDDGTNYDGPNCPLDLVADWVEPGITIRQHLDSISPTTWAPVAGKFGKTRDGRKVGPMESQRGIWPFLGVIEGKSSAAFNADGTCPYYPKHDLISEWPAEVAVAPATATPEVKWEPKIGDKVRVARTNIDFKEKQIGVEFVITSEDSLWDGERSWYSSKGERAGGWRYKTSELEPVTPPTKFKVGDRVRPVNDRLGWVTCQWDAYWKADHGRAMDDSFYIADISNYGIRISAKPGGEGPWWTEDFFTHADPIPTHLHAAE